MSEMDMEDPEYKAKQLRFEYSTADLIAELERRRPKCSAETCEHMGSEVCGVCIWGVFIGELNGTIKDNFKEAK